MCINFTTFAHSKDINNERKTQKIDIYSNLWRRGRKCRFTRCNGGFDAVGTTLLRRLGICSRHSKPRSCERGRVGIRDLHLLDVPLLNTLPLDAARFETQGGIPYPRPYNDLSGHCRILHSDCALCNWWVARHVNRYYSMGYGAIRHLLQVAIEAFYSVDKPYDLPDYGLDDRYLLPALLEQRLYPTPCVDWRRRNLLHHRRRHLRQEGF